MDSRTTQLLKALDGDAFDLLVEILARPGTEKELVERAGTLLQPTVHKKLDRLAQAGLIRKDKGAGGRGQPWEMVAPEATETCVRALLDLADALETADREARGDVRGRLDPREQPRLRSVSG